ncbi:sel1 repeat family protein [Nitrogeniibacter mangrovi]|uniref:Sel1 repeat family protein n=1 Tax=Nitrogeniibacter mangrovi TaxID=2016596 RepID=A0A6C1B024_9RHOO|nr:SEL1-like repeat protein [Nitrogeniibacter mangrovi]QID16339.1 sel1 repeat family protein [Nitrogeniibacter mangrovi]
MLRLAACLLALGVLATPSARAHSTHLPEGPVRVWQAVMAHASRDARVDAARLEGITRIGTAPVRIWLDWDEIHGGTRLGWQAVDRPVDAPAVQAWLRQVARSAAATPRPHGDCLARLPGDGARCTDTADIAADLLAGAMCGDDEAMLALLADCARRGHAGAMIRLSQMYESGTGLPRRPERATAWLARAARAHTPGYRLTGMTLFATALYFGVGIAPDRPAALELFRQAAAQGDADAAEFLRTGTHHAWRRADGRAFADPAFIPARPRSQTPDQ